MQRVGPLDVAWLFLESQSTPMHVGCLQIFKPKPGRGRIAEMLRALKDAPALAPPFSLRVEASGRHALMPHWVEDPAPDMDHHVRRWSLPAPGGESELQDLVSHLLGLELDMERPLWEAHLIDGLSRGRCALMIKMHHSLIDGIGGMQILQAALSEDPAARELPPPWAPHPAAGQAAHLPADEHQVQFGAALHALRGALGALPDVGGALGGMAWAALRRRKSRLTAPYTAPHCILNQRISTQRAFATLSLPFDPVRELAHSSRTTINDVLLCLFAGALRRYLGEREALPADPLIAGLPVSLRAAGDMRVGTAVTFILASLATDVAEPRARLQAIHSATVAAKSQLRGLNQTALTEYTLLLMAPFMTELAAGLAGRTRPVFNLVISNVPGPARPLYYNGARLEAMYPMSIATHGQGLNITIMSYAGQLDIGFTGCSRSVPHIERLAHYTQEELQHLAGGSQG